MLGCRGWLELIDRMASPSHHPHDHFFRSTFSQIEVISEYLRYFLSPELSERLDLNSLAQENASYLDDQLNEHFSDIIYSCKYGEGIVNVTILLEHKSYVPALPWLQLLQYLTNGFNTQTRQESFSGTLSPIIPIIIYHGDRQWKMKPIEEYFNGIDSMTLPFVPRFTYLLTDLSDYSEEELLSMDGSWAKRVFMALKISRQKNIFRWLEALFRDMELKVEDETTFNFFQWIVVYLFKSGVSKSDIMSTIKNLKEPVQGKALTIYETILLEGELKGIEKGEIKGELKNKFLVFKNGLKMQFDLETLIQLTDIELSLAKKWAKLLQQNPDAEFPQK